MAGDGGERTGAAGTWRRSQASPSWPRKLQAQVPTLLPPTHHGPLLTEGVLPPRSARALAPGSDTGLWCGDAPRCPRENAGPQHARAPRDQPREAPPPTLRRLPGARRAWPLTGAASLGPPPAPGTDKASASLGPHVGRGAGLHRSEAPEPQACWLGRSGLRAPAVRSRARGREQSSSRARSGPVHTRALNRILSPCVPSVISAPSWSLPTWSPLPPFIFTPAPAQQGGPTPPWSPS